MMNRTQKAKAFRNLAELQFKAILPDLTAAEVLSVEPFVEKWMPGKYSKGDVRRHDGQVWECAQAHDNANNPDIEPSKSPAQWFAYHSKDPADAKPYVPVQGAHDAYQKGEYCIYEGAVWLSKINANTWTPTDYPAGWEQYQG